jgi:hypothetical protein
MFVSGPEAPSAKAISMPAQDGERRLPFCREMIEDQSAEFDWVGERAHMACAFWDFHLGVRQDAG